jgi:hypothetical protein
MYTFFKSAQELKNQHYYTNFLRQSKSIHEIEHDLLPAEYFSLLFMKH